MRWCACGDVQVGHGVTARTATCTDNSLVPVAAPCAATQAITLRQQSCGSLLLAAYDRVVCFVCHSYKCHSSLFVCHTYVFTHTYIQSEKRSCTDSDPIVIVGKPAAGGSPSSTQAVDNPSVRTTWAVSGRRGPLDSHDTVYGDPSRVSRPSSGIRQGLGSSAEKLSRGHCTQSRGHCTQITLANRSTHLRSIKPR